ncbi:MAG: EamA family transporter [Oligoflexia bacterium]|nr:EamA family transporter [Oligoflexia bacterium]
MGPALILCAAILWGLIGPASRFALNDGVSAMEIAFWRAAIAGVFFALQTGLRRERGPVPRRMDLAWVVAFGVAGVAALEASNLLAVAKGGAAFASILLYSAPAWVALFSTVFFREPPSRLEGSALAASLAGVAGVAIAGGAGFHFGAGAIFWGMVSGWSYALFYLFGRVFFSRYSPQLLYAYAFPIGAIALAPWVEFHPKSTTAWASIAFVGVASTYLAYLAYSEGLRRMNIKRASIIASLEPLVSAVAAYALWGEALSGWGYFWGAWVVAGVVLAHRAHEASAVG